MVFVLATTEAHKVPATIVDRCHRFDFRRPSLEQIAGVLRRVSAEEGITIPDPAVGMIARKATGSFRDALGTLEQLVTYGGTEVALEDVLENLGAADAELILDATDALIAKRAEAGAAGRADAGRVRPRLRPVHARPRRPPAPPAGGADARRGARLVRRDRRALATGWPPRPRRSARARCCAPIDLLAAAMAAVKEGSEPRLQLEVALLKATQPQADQSLQALMFRIDQLEARHRGSVAAAAGGAGRAPADGAPPPLRRRSRRGHRPAARRAHGTP